MSMSKKGSLMIFLLLPLSVFAQEEHHRHNAHTHPKYAKIKNPVAMTAQSITQGRQLYGKHCISCHGGAEKGSSPDLTAPVLIHGNTDGEIFHVITDGVAETKMKGFKKELNGEMRWNLVNYIKSLRKVDHDE